MQMRIPPLVPSVAALLTLLALNACDDRMIPAEAPSPSEATMPRTSIPVASATVTQGAASVAAAQAPSAPGAHHAIVVTSCAIDKNGCEGAQPTSPQSEATSLTQIESHWFAQQ